MIPEMTNYADFVYKCVISESATKETEENQNLNGPSIIEYRGNFISQDRRSDFQVCLPPSPYGLTMVFLFQLDRAVCDGPIRFQRIVNDNFSKTAKKASYLVNLS